MRAKHTDAAAHKVPVGDAREREHAVGIHGEAAAPYLPIGRAA
jgi:hypothetical protein